MRAQRLAGKGKRTKRKKKKKKRKRQGRSFAVCPICSFRTRRGSAGGQCCCCLFVCDAATEPRGRKLEGLFLSLLWAVCNAPRRHHALAVMKCRLGFINPTRGARSLSSPWSSPRTHATHHVSSCARLDQIRAKIRAQAAPDPSSLKKAHLTRPPH